MLLVLVASVRPILSQGTLLRIIVISVCYSQRDSLQNIDTHTVGLYNVAAQDENTLGYGLK